MQTFPMFLKVAGRPVMIFGGGEQAAQKCRLLLKTEARIILVAPQLDPELTDLLAEGRISHCTDRPRPELVKGTALVFIATGCPGLDASLQDLAKLGGAVVNVVDQPELCDALTPSIVDRDPVVVAIGTEGAGPVLARQIKTRLEELLEPRLGELVALAGHLRGAVAQRVPQEKRRAFWRWVFTGAPRQRHAAGAEREAARLIKDAIAAGGAPERHSGGLLSIIPCDGARDHLTLQAVARLQEADLILFDPEFGAPALELARRDAARLPISGVQAPSDPHAAIAEILRDAGRVAVLTAQPEAWDGPAIAACCEASSEKLAGLTPV